MRSFAIIILLACCLNFSKAETGGAHFVVFGQLSQKDVKELIRHLNISHASRVSANVCIFIIFLLMVTFGLLNTPIISHHEEIFFSFHVGSGHRRYTLLPVTFAEIRAGETV